MTTARTRARAGAAASGSPTPWSRLRVWRGWPRWRRRARKFAPWALAAVVLTLVGRQAGTIDWSEVGRSLQQQPKMGLALTAGLSLLSYALFGSYDLVGRRVTAHHVSAPRTVGIAAMCYAFNLNFGALVGAIALKLRLYGRQGLKAGTVARVIGLSIVTNWLGYLALGGTVLALAPPPLPPQLQLSETAVRAIGALMVACSAAYLVLCAVRGGRRVRWRRHRFVLPRVGIALWQLAVSSANWALMGVIVWILLQHAVPYPTVLAVLLLAAVAGVVTHVPAGLGVIETVFVASLAGQLGSGPVLAALVSYRAVYYLMPVALAAIGYFWGETRPGSQVRRSDT
jgi:glycosyltransferase 2 family protein